MKKNKSIEICQKITDAFKVPIKQTKEEEQNELKNNLKKVVLFTGGGLALGYLSNKL